MDAQTNVAVDAAPAARTTPESWDWHWRRIRLPQRPRWFNPNAVYARRLVMRAIRPGMGSLFEVGCAPGGRVVVGVPNLQGVSGAIFRRASPTLLRSHRVLSPADLLAAARQAGLEPAACGYGGPLAAFVWLDRVKGRLSHVAGYAFAVALAALTYPGRGRRLSGTVYLIARKP